MENQNLVVKTDLQITKDDLVNIVIEDKLQQLEVQEKVLKEALDNINSVFEDIELEFKNRISKHVEDTFDLTLLKKLANSMELEESINNSYHGNEFLSQDIKTYGVDKNASRNFEKCVSRSWKTWKIYNNYTYKLELSNETTRIDFTQTLAKLPKTITTWFKKAIITNVEHFHTTQSDLLSVQSQIHDLLYNSNRIKATVLKSALNNSDNGKKLLGMMQEVNLLSISK